jgi:hypothetical protein
MIIDDIKDNSFQKCEKNYKFINLLQLISESQKQHILFGGFSLVVYYKKIYRCHKDIDISFLYEDLNFWKIFFNKLGFKEKAILSKNYNKIKKLEKVLSYPYKTKIEMQKEDLKLDLMFYDSFEQFQIEPVYFNQDKIIVENMNIMFKIKMDLLKLRNNHIKDLSDLKNYFIDRITE